MKDAVTNKISKVHFGDELWIVSDDWYILFLEKSHQKETKVDLENQLRKKKLYQRWCCYSTMNEHFDWILIYKLN